MSDHDAGESGSDSTSAEVAAQPWWRRPALLWAATGGLALLAAVGFAQAFSVQAASGEAERAAEAELAGLQSELDDAHATVVELEAQTEELEDALATAEGEARRNADGRNRAEQEAAALEEEIAELTERYDPQIRAELEDAVDAEITRACQAAEEDIDADITDLVDYDAAWDPVTDQDSIVEAVTDCASEERSRTAEEREQARLADCETIDRGQVERNPDAFEGDCLHMFARIVQFDSATGPCSFHARVAAEHASSLGGYDVRSAFGYEDSPLLSTLVQDCPDLDGVSNNDIVEVWATGLGSYSYDTAIGGSSVVPSFKIDTVELVEARD